MRKSLFFAFFIPVLSCTKKSKLDTAGAKKLFSEAMTLTDKRISIQSRDKKEALILNQKAIQKFEEAYNLDSTLNDVTLFISECTMYEKDYKECIFWTNKLSHSDTSKANQSFCTERIAQCQQGLTK